jgi:hypothetical protein
MNIKSCIFLIILFFLQEGLIISSPKKGYFEEIMNEIFNMKNEEKTSITNNKLVFDINNNLESKITEIESFFDKVNIKCITVDKSNKDFLNEIKEFIAVNESKINENIISIESDSIQVEELKKKIQKETQDYEDIIAMDLKKKENRREENKKIKINIGVIEEAISLITNHLLPIPLSGLDDNNNFSFIEMKENFSKASKIFLDNKDILNYSLLSNFIKYPQKSFSNKKILSEILHIFNKHFNQLKEIYSQNKKDNDDSQRIKNTKEIEIKQYTHLHDKMSLRIDLMNEDNIKLDNLKGKYQGLYTKYNQISEDYQLKCENMKKFITSVNKDAQMKIEILSKLSNM